MNVLFGTPVGLLILMVACVPAVWWFSSPVPLASKILLPLALISGIVATVTTVQGNVIVGTLAGGIATFSGTAESHLRHKRDKLEEKNKPHSRSKHVK